MTMKASFKGKFDVDKSSGTASLAFNAGNVKLRATMTDAALVVGPSLNGLFLAVEKPGFFIIDYNVPKKNLSNLESVCMDSLNKSEIELESFSFYDADVIYGSICMDSLKMSEIELESFGLHKNS
ncbi:hypothetical protein CARUB_v10012500mg [Capsella rubella]|uniref:Uncharacterized protein n=1 Tax=Capsella rubella TaxID=81985 RepID=R0IQB0_9BRAS|nr:outer envelope pore protein 24A, chloroplastic [Capsella rubella]EOA39408.1 hypothetical protein CARUB_v10012500mg [Capsella rubella]